MKFLSIAALVSTYAASVAAVPQITSVSPSGQPLDCTYTATICDPFGGDVKVYTIYEQPGTTTTTRSFDCQGCEAVSVFSKDCYGPGLPIRTTSFTLVDAQSTATANVCSPTPN